jgi:two-component system OmpR family sensor kinase
MSLRSRLIAGFTLVAIVLFGVAALNTLSTRSELIGQIDDRLALLSKATDDGRFPAPGDDGFDPDVVPPPPDGDGRVPFERLSDVYEAYYDEAGTLRFEVTPNQPGDAELGAPEIDPDDAPTTGRLIVTTRSDVGDTTYRTLLYRLDDGGIRVVAIPIDDVQDTIERLLLVQVLGSLGILAALGLVGWWVVHLGIRPVKEMTQTATRIAEGDLTVRVPEGRPGTESGELAVALNRMLGHIEGALDERARSEQRLRRFVADASHELRTPLTTIRGYAELYRMGGLADAGNLDDAMRRTEQEATRMGRLVEDMLVLAKLDEERPLDRRPVDLVKLARDAATDAHARAPERPIEFEPSMPSAVVSGDEDRLRQVIANVVGNALVHTEGSVPVTIRVERDGADVVLSVADEGPGMADEVAARVTERFFRADPARSRHRGGSGLGLSIVDAAVSAHGGTVVIDSVEGRGTTVRLIIPGVD